MSHLIIDIDCLNIKMLSDSTDGERTVGVHVLPEMQPITSQFQGLFLLYVSRTANPEAGKYAREALYCNNFIYLTIPDFLIEFVKIREALAE